MIDPLGTRLRRRTGYTGSALLEPLRHLAMSLMFLTRLPIPFSRTVHRASLADSMGMFPVAGAIIGLCGAGVLVVLHMAGLPAHLSATLAVAATLLITGCLHEDGLADTADGFWGGGDRASRLLIMRDSRIGTYGTIALILAVAIRVMALAEIVHLQWVIVIILTATAGAFSRAMMVDLMWSTSPARSDGLSHMAGRPERHVALVGILVALLFVVATGFAYRPDAALLAVAGATLATAAMRAMAIRFIDGQTGDVCGAAQVVSEAAMLIVFAAMVR
jgi:adenosylcobinamide-GDP ribazoletransferase